jgi:hypothetical protein
MISKEVLEIRKLIKKDSDSSIRVCGCYVAGNEKEKLTYINDYLSNMPDEEQNKYAELLKKTLSGSIGKNLHNLEFTKEAEEEDGQQRSLLALRAGELKSQEALDNFYDFVIDKFDYVGNYLILLMYDTYDVPTKGKDNVTMDDSSEVFQYIVCCLCPVNLSKAGLSYHEENNSIEPRTRDWVVEPPCMGFMFPAFNDRSTDIHNLLYYVKSTKEMYSEFITEALGCTETIPSADQKQMFKDIIEQAIVNQPDYEVVNVVRDINENLTEMIENHSGDEPVTLGKEEIKNLFQASGVKEEDLEKVDTRFADELGEDMRFNANDIQEKRKFEVKTNNVVINVKPEDSNIVKIKIIDGRKCLVIPMDNNVEINGIMSIIKEELEKNSEE